MATFLQMYLYSITWSAIATRSAELHVDLALPAGGDLVVLRLDGDAALDHRVHHLGAEVDQLSAGGTGK